MAGFDVIEQQLKELKDSSLPSAYRMGRRIGFLDDVAGRQARPADVVEQLFGADAASRIEAGGSGRDCEVRRRRRFRADDYGHARHP